MGNCMVVHNDNRIVSLSPQDDVEKPKQHFNEKQQRRRKKEMNKSCAVRFDDDGGGGGKERSSGGVRRIRVMVTKQELREILMQHGHELTLEQIVKAARRRNVVVDDDDGCEEQDGCWRPTLESIPEDH